MKRLVANPVDPDSFIAEILGRRYTLPPWWRMVLRDAPERVAINVPVRHGMTQMRATMELYERIAFKSGRRWGKTATTRAMLEAEARRVRAGAKRAR